MCLNPLKARIFKDLKTGKNKVSFVSDYSVVKTDTIRDVSLPCGKCIECLNDYSTEWAYRIMCESLYHEESCFLTLTYRDNPISLVKKDLQDFLKRLRYYVSKENKNIRYFACGEYGAKGKRPHYHLIIFGWCPKDLELLKHYKSHENALYTSKFLESVWTKGFVSVGLLSLYSAKYCAKYMQKLNSISDDLVKPFICCSLKPGIGYDYIFNHLEMVDSDKIYFNGSFRKVPRYFLKVLDSKKVDLEKLKNRRILKADLLSLTDEELERKRICCNSKFKII